MRRHDYAAEGVLREHVRSQPDCPERYRKLAAWLTRAGRLAQAREVLQSGLAQAARTASLYHLLGLIFAGAGRYDAAERHLVHAASQEPACFEYLRDLALVQAAAGKIDESVETLRQAVGLAGEGPADLLALLRVGQEALAQSGVRPDRRPPRPRRRAALVETLVGRDPQVAEALVAHEGDVTPAKREVLRAARQALRRLADRYPAYPDLYFGMSLVAEHLGEVDHAIEAAEKALDLNPRYAEACLLAVRLYEKRGDASRAADRCSRVTELQPEWVDAHVRLGHLLGEQGRFHEAADAYRRALAIDGDCPDAIRQLESLEEVLTAEGGDG